MNMKQLCEISKLRQCRFILRQGGGASTMSELRHGLPAANVAGILPASLILG